MSNGAPVGQPVPDREPDLDPDARARRVEELLAACLERPASARAAALEDACGSHPDLASDLRRQAALLVDLGFGDGFAPDEGADPPETLGDFRPLELLGEGGMGLVYRAEQASLEREVALKLVRPESLAFASTRARFRREVEAVARLGHPGIVQVHAVGEERGIPYFAMELVEGCSLAELLAHLRGRDPAELRGADLGRAFRELTGLELQPGPDAPFERSWEAACLELARQVAGALVHAHERGVIHRDVKPSNIMLARRGAAQLVDFGLTHSGGDVDLTRSGSQPGTLLYMAPEQVRGDAVSVQTDVYALGATLHELFTLEPPVRDSNRRRIEERILGGDVPAPRTRNARLSREADAVCQTAMAPELERRYVSMELFESELAAALAGRPVLARPPGAGRRLARWVRMHPAWSVAAAALLLISIGIPAALLRQSRAHNRDLEDLLEAERRARAAQESALFDSEASLAVLGSLLAQAEPGNARGRDLSLLDALDAVAARIEFEESPYMRARIQNVVGEAYNALGRYAQALPLLEAALAPAEDVDERTAAYRYRATSALARSHEGLGDLVRAESSQRRALELAADIDAEAVAITRSNLAGILAQTNRVSEAIEHYREALEVYRASPDTNPVAAAVVGSNLASLLARADRTEEARPLSHSALATMREQFEAPHPQLVGTLSVLGVVERRRGDHDAAEAAYLEALEMSRQLYGESSEACATLLYNLASLEEARGNLDAALERFDRALPAFEDCGRADHPLAATTRRRIDAITSK